MKHAADHQASERPCSSTEPSIDQVLASTSPSSSRTTVVIDPLGIVRHGTSCKPSNTAT